MRICTIIARNYLAQARVLAESYAAHNGGAPTTVLVVDDPERSLDDSNEPFDIVRPDELDIERFKGMAAMYETIELATAVKPWFLSFMLEREGAPVAYLDPDIRFFGPIDEIARLATEHDVVLTPHVAIQPIPRDGKQPSEIDLLASGTYNLGFIALRPGVGADRLIDWWSERLRYDCVIDHAMGLFVDQRWFDLVQSVVPDVATVRDPGVNIAYWNLHERTVRRAGDGYVVNGEPLRFFHFSGYDPDQPHRLSKHQSRTRLTEEPLLAELFDDYAAALREHGLNEGRRFAPHYDKLADGTPWTSLLRRAYANGERVKAFRFDPFTEAGTEEFYAWLREPGEAGSQHGLNRMTIELYRRRPDLPTAFPDLAGSDGANYLEWFHTYAVRDHSVPLAVMPRYPDAPPSESDDEPFGVNVAGYLRSELGVGEAARTVIWALDTVGVPALPIQGGEQPSSRQGHDFSFLDPSAAPFPVNIVCVNADGLPEFQRSAGRELMEGRYNIGFWWWEVSTFPDKWLGSFNLLDEIWVATEHVAEAIAPKTTIPVVKLPIPVQMATPPALSRAQLGLPEGFLFLFIFDYHSVFGRKNPLGVLDAFKRAFPPGSGAKLALKCINQENDVDNHDRLLLAASEHPDVTIVDRYVSAAEKNAMITSADCYVSLHRSEGFGLTPAEAMYVGKPVIATGYSGNVDFMTPKNSYLVDFEMTRIGEGNYPYPAEGEWAEPDLDHAAELMRRVFDDPAEARRVGKRAANDIRKTNSPEAAGQAMARRLEAVRERLPAIRAARRPDEIESVEAIDVAHDVIGEGMGEPEHQGRLGRFIRRIVLRLTRPITFRQDRVNRAVLDAVREVDARTTASERRILARQGVDAAAVLAATRRTEAAMREAASTIEELRAEIAAANAERAVEQAPFRAVEPGPEEHEREADIAAHRPAP